MEMKAIVIEEFGDKTKLKYTDVEKPCVSEGQVLIRIYSAGVNPVDCKIREGLLQKRIPHKLPLIPGWDLAGVIEEVGHGVKRFNVGDEVWSYARRPEVEKGTYAQYIVLPECYVALKPTNLSFEHAASVPLAGLTAYQCLYEQIQIKSGQTVMIHGASGGVGSFAVQLAKLAGARVIAVASGDNADYLEEIGADLFIDYKKGNLNEQLKKLINSKADIVFDCVGLNVNQAVECTREGGKFISILNAVTDEMKANNRVQFFYHFVEPNVVHLDVLKKLFEEKKLASHVQYIFNLYEAEKAHAQMETGHTKGKIVLKIKRGLLK